jgi:hypothetical protein
MGRLCPRNRAASGVFNPINELLIVHLVLQHLLDEIQDHFFLGISHGLILTRIVLVLISEPPPMPQPCAGSLKGGPLESVAGEEQRPFRLPLEQLGGQRLGTVLRHAAIQPG